MIAINRLLMTLDGWSYNTQKRLEKGVKELGVEDEVIFYPNERLLLNRGELFESFLQKAMEYSVESAKVLSSLNKEKDIERVIFLEPFQFPYLQIITANYRNAFDVFMHSSKQYNRFYRHHNLYNNFYDSFESIISYTSYSDTYKCHFFRAVGGWLDEFDEKTAMEEKAPNYVWAGSRFDDDVKGWDIFIRVVNDNPDRNFIACLDKNYDHNFPNLKVFSQLSSKEFIEICSRNKYILSTARLETFGYAVMDAICKGATPIVPNEACYKELIPEKFRYDLDDITTISFDVHSSIVELSDIVMDFHYTKTTKRLLEEFYR